MKLRPPEVLLGAAGAAWLLGQGLLPDMGADTSARYEAVSAATGREALSAALLVIAGCLLVLGALATHRALHDVRGRGRRLVTVGAAMLALGGVWLVAGRAAFNMTFLRVTDDEVPPEVAIRILDDGGGAEFLPLVLTLPCLLLGPVLLAFGLRRAGMVGWLPLVLWVVGIGTFLATEFASKAGEVTGIAMAALALALGGRAASNAGPEATAPQPARAAAAHPAG